MNGWETWVIIGAVVFATLYLVRVATSGKKKSCGHDCGCGKTGSTSKKGNAVPR